MDEEGSTHPDDDGALLRAAVAAWEWLHLGQWKRAAGGFESALERLAGLRCGEALRAPWRRRLQVGLAEALANLGRRADSLTALRAAYPALEQVQEQAQEQAPRPGVHEAIEVLALNCLARLHQAERRPAEAAAALQRAQALLPEVGGADSALSLQQARLWSRQAVSLGMQGEVAGALDCHARALAVFDHPWLMHGQRERAIETANWGANLWRSGRTREALVPLRRSIALFQGLADSGRRHELGYAAISQMNLGGVLTELGAMDEAIGIYRAAAATYDELLRLPAAAIDLDRLRASRALTEMNLAYVLARHGLFDEAGSHYRSARRRYKALALEQPQVRDDEARTWVNQAHLLLLQGRAGAAQRLYARGWQAMQSLIEGGRAHLAADAANARLGLGRALAQQGRRRQADAHFAAAQATLVQLTRQGQLQHARAWLKALADHADALLGSRAAGRRHEPADAQALLAALAQPPHLGLPDFASARRDIEEGLARLATWGGAAAAEAPWLPALAAAYLTHLLDRCAWLLGECDPEVLRRHEPDRAALVAALAQAARRCRRHRGCWPTGSCARAGCAHSARPWPRDAMRDWWRCASAWRRCAGWKKTSWRKARRQRPPQVPAQVPPQVPEQAQAKVPMRNGASCMPTPSSAAPSSSRAACCRRRCGWTPGRWRGACRRGARW
jgi:tetratricopeptide (TPR) repeat protein